MVKAILLSIEVLNRDGLIEEVGYFSSELVQNGNFSELGSELVTNGDFATDSNWIKVNATISNGAATFVAGTASLQQSISITVGGTYKITYQINSGTGALYLSSGGFTGVSVSIPSTVGTHEVDVTAANTSELYFVSLGSSNLVIDNVSVKQVDPNDRWTKSNGSTISEDVATVVALGDIGSTPNNWTLYQAVFEQNKTYKVTFKARQKSGSGTFQAGRDYYLFIDEVITSTFTEYSFIIDSGSLNFTGRLTFGGRTSGNEFEVDNVSVVEVQGDRPRLSYDITNGVVEDTPHLLLEPSATNLVTFSEDFSQSYWTKSDTTINVNQSTSPDGTLNADSIVSSTANSAHYLRHTFVAVSANTPHTYSFFIKANGYTKFGVRDNAQTGAYLTYDLETESIINSASMTVVVNKLKDDWFKCSFTSTIGSNGVAGYAFYLLDNSYTTGYLNTYSYTGDGVSGFYIYGFQLEQQSYATSYIPTAGTTITRAAETCNNSKPSVNSTEGVLYAEIQALASDSTDKVITMSDGSTSNRVQVYFNSSNQIVGGLISGGSGQAAITYSTDIKLVSKIAFKYKQNDFALWVNGSEVGTDVVGNPATGLNVIDFDNGAGGANFYGKLKGLAVYNEALSESQLMQLTGVTASSIYNNFVTRTASFTVEALNEVKKVIDNL
jgi:hypothetical protein